MTSPRYIILYSFFLFFSSVHSQSSDHSCNSPLNLPNTLPFDTSSLTCAIVWTAQSFILRYTQASPKVWNFILSAPNTNSYIAMGFSPTGYMEGSRAIVGWVGPDGKADIRNYFLGGKSLNLARLVPSNQGHLIRLVNSSITVQSNHIYMAFQMITDRPSAHLIYAIGSQGRLPSSPNFQLSQHHDMTSTVLNYVTEVKFQTSWSHHNHNEEAINYPVHSSIRSMRQKSFPKKKGNRKISRKTLDLRRTHGVFNIVGWAILMPIGIMVARYMRKWDPAWYYSHSIIQSIALLFGFTGVICGFVMENRFDISVTAHKGIGIFIFILGFLQIIAAFVVRPADKASKYRKYWYWYHVIAGKIVIFFAVINVFYGLRLGKASSGWNVGFAVSLVILVVLSLIFELRMCLSKNEK